MLTTKIVSWLIILIGGLLLIAAALFTSFGSTGHGELKGTIPQKLSAFMDDKALNSDFNGTVLVARNGRVIFQKGYGYANYDEGITNQVDTEYRIASLTKSFTALSILQLEAHGKLNTFDSLSKFIPSFKDGNKITIHELLTHSSGVANHFKLTDTARPITLPAFIELMSKQKLSFTPGTKYKYSDTGYMILAYIIEKVSGENYSQYLNDHIFRIAGMNHTYLNKIDAKNMAVGYKNMKPDEMEDDESQLTGAGDIISTVGDLLKYNNAFHAHKLLPPEEEKKMETGYIDSARWGVFKYGYGWNVADNPISFWRPLIEHSGSLPGFKSEFVDFVDDRVAVIILSNNSGSWNSGALGRELASICLGKRYWFFEKYF